MRLPRPLRILCLFAALGAPVCAFVWFSSHYPAWSGPVLVLSMIGFIVLLGWYGSRIRKRDMAERIAWVPARAVVQSVQTLGQATSAGKVPVRLWVQIEHYNATAQRTRVPVDTEVSPDAIGHFGASTVLRVLHHPTNKLLVKLDGEIPLDRSALMSDTTSEIH